MAAHLDHAVNVPALIDVRQPLGRIFGHLLVTVHAGRCQGEIQEVGSKLSAGCRGGGA